MTNKLSEKGLEAASVSYYKSTSQNYGYPYAAVGVLEHCDQKASEIIQAYLENAWMPIAEAPKDGTDLLTVVMGFQPTVGWFAGDRWTNWKDLHDRKGIEEEYETVLDDEDNDTYRPTHFQYITPLKVSNSTPLKLTGD